MFGTYCRLNVHVLDSDITVIRAARKKLVRQSGKLSAKRKIFYRHMLALHKIERDFFVKHRF